MAGILGFVVGIWNFVVSIAPTVVHTVCQLTEEASTAVRLGGGS